MQKNASNNKNPLKPIYKPYLRGNVVSELLRVIGREIDPCGSPSLRVFEACIS